ncbi:MAG: TetR/AcrR family transcriptional regulator [Rubrivivax sp.]|nr:TetR/AcrR family transcriptional regulator [Rubrivivax sp.]
MTTPLRERMRLVREEAIVDVVNRLLADKGYDFMTVDEVAAEVGMAKASLYKHFASKEALAAAAMVRVLERALAAMDEIERAATPRPAIERLHDMLRWTMRTLYEGRMPSLPAQNSALRTVLTADKVYVNLLLRLSDRLGGWITEAQRDGTVSASLPPEVVLFTLYARACDPVLPLLKASGQYTPDQIYEWLSQTCFGGLHGTAAGAALHAGVGAPGAAAPAQAGPRLAVAPARTRSPAPGEAPRKRRPASPQARNRKSPTG